MSDDWVGQSDRCSRCQWAYESSHSYPVASEGGLPELRVRSGSSRELVY